MTPDEADGLIRYDEQSKQVFVEWNNEQHQRFYYSAKTGIEETVKSLDRNVGIQPKWSAQFDSGTYTRHPLGGCPMGESGIYGVVDHTGQVFIGRLHVYHWVYAHDAKAELSTNSFKGRLNNLAFIIFYQQHYLFYSGMVSSRKTTKNSRKAQLD